MSKLRNASAVVCLLIYFANAWGQEIHYIRDLETDDFFEVVNIDGVAYPPRANSVLALPNTIYLVPKGKQPGDPETLSVQLSDSINMTFDGRANRLFLYEPASSELLVIYLRGQLKIDRFTFDGVGVVNPSGLTVDPKTGRLSIFDGLTITQIDPTQGRKNYDVATASISELSLQTQGQHRGLAYNHADGCLYVTSQKKLYRIDENGGLVHVGDFPWAGKIDLKGLVFARSLDQTDDAKRRNLYVAFSEGPSGPLRVSEFSVTSCAQGSAQ